MLLTVYIMGRVGVAVWRYRQEKPMLECQADPQHFQRIREIHKMTCDTESKKNHGEFNCQFKDRDEVRDMLELMKRGNRATEKLSDEMANLAKEIRLTRNGSRAHRINGG